MKYNVSLWASLLTTYSYLMSSLEWGWGSRHTKNRRFVVPKVCSIKRSC